MTLTYYQGYQQLSCKFMDILSCFTSRSIQVNNCINPHCFGAHKVKEEIYTCINNPYQWEHHYKILNEIS